MKGFSLGRPDCDWHKRKELLCSSVKCPLASPDLPEMKLKQQVEPAHWQPLIVLWMLYSYVKSKPKNTWHVKNVCYTREMEESLEDTETMQRPEYRYLKRINIFTVPKN